MSKLEQILEESLAQLDRGETTLEECLRRYPEHAVELRRLLITAGRLEAGQAVRPTPRFKARTRAQLVAHMRSQPRHVPVKPRLSLFPRGFGLVLGRAFNTAASLAAMLFLLLGTVTVLAQTALPGDSLYRWKVASERVWRVVHLDPFDTDLFLAGRRMTELVSVAGDPEAEQIARQEYQQSLSALVTDYPDSQEIISAALQEQQDNLAEVGVDVPELDRLLTNLSSQETRLVLDNQVLAVNQGFITYTVTITNTGPTSPITAALVSQLSSSETFVRADDTACTPSSQNTVGCALENLTTAAPRRLNLTTMVDRCYVGVVTQTTTISSPEHVSPPLKNSALATSTITAAYPRPAQVVYVQSSSQAHDLSLITPNNQMLNRNLHLWAAAPVWSPDGAKLAFSGQPGINQLEGTYSQGSGIWLVDVVNAEARNARQLVAEAHINNIAWSADGSKLAFEVAPPGVPHEVRVIKASDGQELSRFPGEQPAWHPNNQNLIIKNCSPDCGLWQVDLEGRPQQQITTGGTDSYPVWSPTGEYLAFSSQRDGNWEIYLLRPADGELRRLTQRPGTDTTPVFDSCGQNLYLRTDAFGSWWITVMRLDGSDERKIQEGVGPSEDWGLARPAVF